MKNYLAKTFLLLAMVALIPSCSKDSDNQCTPIICKNGGVSTPACGCNCPTGFTGPDCAIALAPKKIIVHGITVTQFPPTVDGHDWDDTAVGDFRKPDIYVKFENETTTLYDGSSVAYQDADYNGVYPFIPIPAVTITDVTGLHALLLYNENVGTDQLMIVPTFYLYTAGQTEFPAELTYEDPSGFNFKFSVTYEF